MKASLTRTLSTLVVLLSVFLAGCAGQLKQLPDGTFFGMTTVGDTLDRSASHIGLYEQKVDAAGKLLFHPDGRPQLVAKEKGQMSVGATVAGQAVVGAVSGTGAAWIQGDALKDATKLGKCADGANCGTVNNVVTSSGAASQSVNQNSSTVGVKTGGGCGSACAPKYAD